MKECFGYIRVSTVKQGEGVSLEAQRTAILTFATPHGISIVRWYEETQTAAKTGRPIFAAMLKELLAGGAKGVVMHKIDRSARNFADWAKIGEMSDAGIDVYFASESLDFRSRGGRLVADIQAVIAADYIRNLREECIKGLTGRLNQGMYPFAAPIGYLNNGGGKPKTPDSARAALVRQAFELYASGRHSLRSLVVEMARRGLKNRSGRSLTKGGIEAMLGNPFYCGLMQIKRTGAMYQGVHKALISASTFQRVQAIRVSKGIKRVTRHDHTYAGLFSCHFCKRSMIPELQKGHVYYRCHTPDCETKSVREELLDAAISSALARARFQDEDESQLVTAIKAWCDQQLERDQGAGVQLQLHQVESRLHRLTDAVIDGLIDKDIYAERKEALMIERKRLQEVTTNRADQGLDEGHVVQLLELAKCLTVSHRIATPREKRELAEMTTSNRTVAAKDVAVEPAKWLLSVKNTLTVLSGGPYRPNSRNRRRAQNAHIVKLIEIARSEEVATVKDKLSILRNMPAHKERGRNANLKQSRFCS